MLTVLLTRHGHTVASEPDRYLGQRYEAPLSERGRSDAARLARRLREVPITRVIASPLPRAAETAAIVAADRLRVETDDRLMEMDYGTWEGATLEEVERRFPGEYARYEDDPSSYSFEGGEGSRQVAQRVASLVSDLLDWAGGDEGPAGPPTVLVVGHSSLNRIMMSVLLETPLRDYRRRFQFDWASLTVLRWQTRASGPLLLLANDVAHLNGTAGVTWS